MMKIYPPPCEDPLDYVPFLNPGWRKPEHLQTMGGLALEIATWARGDSDKPIRELVTYPIRHFKSETILAICVWLLEQFPWMNIMLLAYDDDRVHWLGNRLRELCLVVKDRPYVGPTKGWNRVDHWKNSEGGGVTILSSKQSREGFTCHCLIADDPINEKQVAKIEERDACDNAINFYTGRTLLFRDGGYVQGPVIIVASRFSRDDMIGRRLERPGWHHSYAPAITKDDKPFAPNVFTLEQLKSIRAELAVTEPREETWYSRWQGTPKEDRGADKFKEHPALYDFLPKGSDAIGIDFIGEESRWFAMTRVRVSGGCVFVRECARFVADPNELAKRVNESFNTDGRCDVYAFMSGSERIAIRRMQEQGIIITPLTAGQNRLWRTLPTMQIWEEDKILWPHDGSGKASIARISRFTGGEDEDNDEVDALVAVVEGSMLWNASSKPFWVGKRRQLP
jgi:hypothetical protein